LKKEDLLIVKSNDTAAAAAASPTDADNLRVVGGPTSPREGASSKASGAATPDRAATKDVSIYSIENKLKVALLGFIHRMATLPSSTTYMTQVAGICAWHCLPLLTSTQVCIVAALKPYDRFATYRR
jgi:hypothetical protein